MANVSSSNGLEKRPKIRFPGFDEPWRAEKLSDFAERITRKNSNNETDLPLTISSKDGLVDQISYFNKTVASKDMSGYYLLRNGEYAYNKSYSVGYDFGSIKRLDRYPMGALSTLYICFALKKHNTDFIKVYFDSLKWYKEIYMISAEGARNHGLLNVPTDEFFATKHYLPENTTEQRKIADFLIALERRIDAQQSLVDNLKKYKRGVTRAIFSKELSFSSEGSQYPQWDQKLIGEICKIQTGKSNTQDETDEGLYPFYVRSPVVRKSYRYLFNCEAVLTVGDGVGTGKVFHYVTGKFDLHQRVYAMTDFRKVSGKYFYYYFSHFFYDRVMRMTAKTSVDSVRYEMIDKMPILIPCEEEQNQIVFFLDRLGAQLKDAENSNLDCYNSFLYEKLLQQTCSHLAISFENCLL